MAVSMIGPKFYAWDKNGKPLAFGKLYTYQARTNTPKPTYQSEDQVVENENPVILNGEGYANVYLSGSYKMVLKDSYENEIWSSDPVSSAQPGEWVNCLSANYVSSTTFKVIGNFTEDYEPGRKVRIDNNTSEFSYSVVVDSVYAAGETTITIADPVVSTGITEACRSIVGPNSSTGKSDIGNFSGFSFSSYQKMKDAESFNGEKVSFVNGSLISSGQTIWQVTIDITLTQLDGGLYAKPISKVYADDFELNKQGGGNNKANIELADSVAYEFEKKLHLPAADILFNQEINLTTLVDTDGVDSVRLIFDQTMSQSDGVVFGYGSSPKEGKQFGFAGGVTVCCKAANGLTAVKSPKGLYFSKRPKFKIQTLEVQDFDGPDLSEPGFPTLYSWLVGLDVGDAQGLEVGDYYYYGNYRPELSDNNQYQTVGLKLDSTETLLFSRLGAIWINAPRKGIEIAAKSFYYFDSIDITRSYIGFEALGANNFSEVYVNRLSVNAQYRGVHVEDITRFFAKQGFVNSRSDAFDHGLEWTGYFFKNLQKSNVGDITAQPTKEFAGGRTGILARDCGGTNFGTFIAGANITRAFVADNCAGCNADIIWQSADTSLEPLRIVNNTRSCDFGVNLSPSFAGSAFSDDGSIDYRTLNIKVTGGASGYPSVYGDLQCVTALDVLPQADTFGTANGFRFNIDNDGQFRLQLLDIEGNSTNNVMLIDRDVGTNTIEKVEIRSGGVFVLPSLPTSSTGLPAGAVWSNNGVLTIV